MDTLEMHIEKLKQGLEFKSEEEYNEWKNNVIKEYNHRIMMVDLI